MFQIFQHLDGDTSKFSDKLDRLYITNGRFDLNLVFSEANIHASVDLIAVLDKDSGHIVPHYTTDPGNIRVIWRTIVQVEDSRDSQAVGFRMLAFTTGNVVLILKLVSWTLNYCITTVYINDWHPNTNSEILVSTCTCTYALNLSHNVQVVTL